MKTQPGPSAPGHPRRGAPGGLSRGGPRPDRRGAPGRLRRGASRRIRRRRTWRTLRRRVTGGALGRVLLGRVQQGAAGSSPRLRRWVLAVVLLGVALLPYPLQGAFGSSPAAACRSGCRAGSVPSMVRWTVPLGGSWDVVPGLTGTVPSSGQAYAAVGHGVAAVGHGLTVSGYATGTGSLLWSDTLTGFGAGASIVSVRTWPGEVTAGIYYRSGRDRTPARAEVVISDAGVLTGRYAAARFGGAVAGTAQYTVIVGPAAITSYDNATGRVRWRQPTGRVAQAWRLDGGTLYMGQSSGGFVGSDPVTALRRIVLATGAARMVHPLEGASFDGTLSAVTDGVALFSSAAGVTAYSGTSGVRLWSIAGAVPEGSDTQPARAYLTRGSNLIGVNPQTGRVASTVSGSAVNGTAGVYVVRAGVALGLDQGAKGDAWGYSIASQRVTLAAPGLPWPHYFVDLSGVGGSAGTASSTVIIAACKQLAPGSLTQPSPTASTGSPSGSAGTTPGTGTTPGASTGAGATPGQTATPAPRVSPSAAASSGQACLRPELIALNL